MYRRIVPVIKSCTVDGSYKCANYLNLLGNQLFLSSQNAYPLSLDASRVLGAQTRTYKAAVNIEWVPPQKVSGLDPINSGDRGTLPQVDLSRPQYKFSRVKPQVQFTERDEYYHLFLLAGFVILHNNVFNMLAYHQRSGKLLPSSLPPSGNKFRSSNWIL